MLHLLKSLFGDRTAPDEPQVPAGERVYAVGDVHGRLDLFDPLIEAIEQDDAAGPPARTRVILLGDLVDRGPHSAQVVARVRAWQQQREVRVLLGNHEEMFLGSFKSLEMLRHLLRHGGRETLLSFGLDRKAMETATLAELQERMTALVTRETRDYIASFEDMIQVGDYLFVHAGIEPDVGFDVQRKEDLRWIREPFLSHSEPHGLVVVHGHTIAAEPEDRGNRIGIDTGAYATGRLTALVLEGTGRRYIEAVQGQDGQIVAAPRATGQ